MRGVPRSTISHPQPALFIRRGKHGPQMPRHSLTAINGRVVFVEGADANDPLGQAYREGCNVQIVRILESSSLLYFLDI